MLLDFEGAQETDSHVALSFREPKGWINFVGVATTIVPIGDEVCGPGIGLTSVTLDVEPQEPKSNPHSHNSDSFKIRLRGGGLSQFRFQAGWRVYGSDSLGEPESDPSVPRGFVVMAADRRGFRGRLAKSVPGSERDRQWEEMHRAFASLFPFATDCIDPDDTCGPSALLTTLGPAKNNGQLNGSFADRDTWPAITPTTRAITGLLGEPTCGPVVIVAATAPNEISTQRCCFGTEVYRLIVDGACDIDGQTYTQGDMRIQRAGEWCGPVVAGPEGVQEYVVVGDRRYADPAVEGEAWPFAAIVRDLQAELSTRPVGQRVTR